MRLSTRKASSIRLGIKYAKAGRSCSERKIRGDLVAHRAFHIRLTRDMDWWFRREHGKAKAVVQKALTDMQFEQIARDNGETL